MVNIIPANKLTKIKTEDIVDMFCFDIMEKIFKANEKGLRNVCFCASTIYLQNGNLVFRYTGEDRDKAIYYSFDDYHDMVAKRFREAGYTIKPTGYIGGVWQRSEDIIW